MNLGLHFSLYELRAAFYLVSMNFGLHFSLSVNFGLHFSLSVNFGLHFSLSVNFGLHISLSELGRHFNPYELGAAFRFLFF